MSLSAEERKSVVTLEYEKATRTFAAIDTLVDNGMWDFVANRLYYATFHAVLALLINDEHKTSTHRGMVAIFGLHYIKTRIFSAEDGKTIARLQTLRDEADYNCAFSASEDDIRPYISKVDELIKKIYSMLTCLDK